MTVPASSRAALVAVLVIIATVAAVAIAAGTSDTVRVLDLARDPATLSGSPAHDGLLTNLSAFTWSATVAVSLFGAWVLNRSGERTERVRFLAWSSVLTVALMVDDIFLIHERLAPQLGLAEETLFVAYAAALVVLLARYRRVLPTTGWPILLASLAVFGAALARNRLLTFPAVLLPDTFAFIGAGLWFVFFLHTAIRWVERLNSAGHSAS